MKEQPLVTVVCLCYNHEQFLEQAILSVLNQSYTNIEIIVIDDFSTDSSVKLIKDLERINPSFQCVIHQQNVGNCKSFNEGLALAKGKYIIDFATDDEMLPNRINEQVSYFESLSDDYGVIYSNTEFIDSNNHSLGRFTTTKLPEGNVFSDVLSRHVFEPSSMMVKTSFFKDIGGYNESLTYEDFDFVLRTSHLKKVGFIDKVLTRRRKVKGSHSAKLVSSRYENMSHSTFLVCKEAREWCATKEEIKAWEKRVKYEAFFAVKNNYLAVGKKYIHLFEVYNVLLFERLILKLAIGIKTILA